MIFVFTAVLLLACLSGDCEAKIFRVSTAGDGSDPSTWPGAFPVVADAIAFATAGDEIWVASGRYNESIVMKEKVSMFGGFAGPRRAISSTYAIPERMRRFWTRVGLMIV